MTKVMFVETVLSLHYIIISYGLTNHPLVLHSSSNAFNIMIIYHNRNLDHGNSSLWCFRSHYKKIIKRIYETKNNCTTIT